MFVVQGDVVREEGGSETGENVGASARKEMPRDGVGVVGVQQGFAEEDGDAWLGVAVGQVQRGVKERSLPQKGVTIEGDGRRSYNQDPV